MVAVRRVEGNSPAEPAALKGLRLGAGLKGVSAAGQDVGHHAGRERDDVADDAGDRQREHAPGNRRTITAKVRHQAEQVLRG